MHRSLVALTLSWVAAIASAQNALPPAALFQQLAPSVWTVRTQDAAGRPLAQGSAVVVGPGRLITNCHVLRQAKSLAVSRENVSYGATLEHPDTERDLCQLKVANFTAPPAAMAPPDALLTGARVYAIGSPRGLETTISDGLLSGIRRGASGAIEALQISVPISPGSSGGGLFDEQGRLIGITTAGLRDSQNLNFALPAEWIADVPARAQAALAAKPATPATGTATASASSAPKGDRVFEYRLRDRLTGIAQPVVYRLDRVNGEERIFNQGERVERAGGGVVSMKSPIGGEFDLAMPPGGWISAPPEMGSAWRLNYEARRGGTSLRMDLRARVLGSTTVRVGQRDVEAIRIEFQGFTSRPAMTGFVRGPYMAQAWYAPGLGRIVRFEARGQGGNGGAFFNIDELIELVDIRSE
ncbi:serine protease [Hydrogenophaga borbori]|uniref:Serine protease n=1 Tax=Hydrogenophaga borbori TaxID=2294117 RepID=A0A372EHA3_9BURK|nr:S1C family serine protease [Hydrogenophaga borbori]RFP77838.1 serine protease [Hydrogenophaga borbori]